MTATPQKRISNIYGRVAAGTLTLAKVGQDVARIIQATSDELDCCVESIRKSQHGINEVDVDIKECIALKACLESRLRALVEKSNPIFDKAQPMLKAYERLEGSLKDDIGEERIGDLEMELESMAPVVMALAKEAYGLHLEHLLANGVKTA